MDQIDDWENGKYGQDEGFVKRSSAGVESSMDDAMNLQMISVRLQKGLIEDLKFIATAHGIGYQPLMRDVLERFVTHAKKEIIQGVRSAAVTKRKTAAGGARRAA